MTAVEAFQTIEEHAKNNRHNFQIIDIDLGVGESYAQGDIRIERLDAMPNSAKKIDFVAKVADGSSEGAQHILETEGDVEMYDLNTGNILDGPGLTLGEGAKVTFTHPRHKHPRLTKEGAYKIAYQRNLKNERIED